MQTGWLALSETEFTLLTPRQPVWRVSGQADGQAWLFHVHALGQPTQSPSYVLRFREQLYFSTLVECEHGLLPWSVHAYETLEELKRAPKTDPLPPPKPPRSTRPARSELEQMWNLSMKLKGQSSHSD